ncbi:MAG: MazG family protein [Opitutales bacterium]|jgi:XTP/dITP diphosphohydrolase/tetrapyrrole methylase family protein/MazG family protein|nr:MAG: MazG family protein [Opitutales bacterium]
MPGIDYLIATTARLRAPDGCPWDKEQNHRTLCDCLIEEVAELVQAIDRNDLANLREELGDLLFHIVMHAQMAAEEGHFNFDDVAKEVNDKMIRRHPHVFGEGVKLGDAEAVIKQWEQIKLTEKGLKKTTLFKELPPSLNTVLTAREVWKQIQKKGYDAGQTVDVPTIASLKENLTEDLAGQKLFEIIAACRDAGIDPDSALRRHTAKVVETAETNVRSS